MEMPCSTQINCPCPISPIGNFSCYDEDLIKFWSETIVEDDPQNGNTYQALGCISLCESTVSQADADQCAANQALQCVLDGETDEDGDPVYPCWNSAQTGRAVCPDGSWFYYTVPAGTILADTCAQANAQALSLAYQRATEIRMCIGDVTAVCVNVAANLEVVATGGTLPMVWSLVDGSLPTGMDWSFSNRTLTLDGTPTTAGDSTFTFRMTDINGNWIEKTFTLSVSEITTATPLPDATEGVAYSQNLAVSGMTAVPLNWEISDGALPAGLDIEPVSGAIVGTPEAGTAGDFTFTVQVTDSNDVACSKEFTMTVLPACSAAAYERIDNESIPWIEVDDVNCYALNSTGQTLLKLTTAMALDSENALGFTPKRIVYDTIGECFYVADNAGGAVYPVPRATLVPGAAIATAGIIYSMLFVPEEFAVYVVTKDGLNYKLWSIDTGTNIPTLLDTNTGMNTTQMFYCPSTARLYGGSSVGAAARLWRWDIGAGTMTTLFNATSYYGCAFDPDTEIAYLEQNGSVDTFDCATEAVSASVVNAAFGQGYMIWDAVRSVVYFRGLGDNITEYNPGTSAVTTRLTEGAYRNFVMIGGCFYAAWEDLVIPFNAFVERYNPDDF